MADIEVDVDALREAAARLGNVAQDLAGICGVDGGLAGAVGGAALADGVSRFVESFGREHQSLIGAVQQMSTDLSGGAQGLRDADLALARALVAAQSSDGGAARGNRAAWV